MYKIGEQDINTLVDTIGYSQYWSDIDEDNIPDNIHGSFATQIDNQNYVFDHYRNIGHNEAKELTKPKYYAPLTCTETIAIDSSKNNTTINENNNINHVNINPNIFKNCWDKLDYSNCDRTFLITYFKYTYKYFNHSILSTEDILLLIDKGFFKNIKWPQVYNKMPKSFLVNNFYFLKNSFNHSYLNECDIRVLIEKGFLHDIRWDEISKTLSFEFILENFDCIKNKLCYETLHTDILLKLFKLDRNIIRTMKFTNNKDILTDDFILKNFDVFSTYASKDILANISENTLRLLIERYPSKIEWYIINHHRNFLSKEFILDYCDKIDFNSHSLNTATKNAILEKVGFDYDNIDKKLFKKYKRLINRTKIMQDEKRITKVLSIDPKYINFNKLNFNKFSDKFIDDNKNIIFYNFQFISYDKNKLTEKFIKTFVDCIEWYSILVNESNVEEKLSKYNVSKKDMADLKRFLKSYKKCYVKVNDDLKMIKPR